MKWEYNIIDRGEGISIEELNQLGQEGWELTSTVFIQTTRWVPGTNIRLDSSILRYYFKRSIIKPIKDSSSTFTGYDDLGE